MENFDKHDPIPEELPEEELTPVTEVSEEAAAVEQTSEPCDAIYEPMDWQPPMQDGQDTAVTGGYPFPPAKPKKQKKEKKEKTPGSGRWWKNLLAAVLVVALVAGGCGVTAFLICDQWAKDVAVRDQEIEAVRQHLDFLQTQLNRVQSGTNSGSSGSDGGTVIVPQTGLTPSQVYDQNVDAVVAVNNRATTNIWGQITERASSGSGFVISENGYIVSNYHVVQGATKLTVILSNGEEYNAMLIGYDEDNDLAVLKIEATGLSYVKLGSSDELIIGDMVVAIGNPLGELTSSLTVGYVSGTNRDFTTTDKQINMLQTDAAINPGNSGGPLFNMRGEVVGITTAKYAGSTIEGLGFAIPIDDIAEKIEYIIERGYVSGAYMGINILELNENDRNVLGIPEGLYVRVVIDGYCAQKAGMRPMDVLTAVDEYTIKTANDLKAALENYNPGDTVKVTVWRAGETIELTLKLDAKPTT